MKNIKKEETMRFNIKADELIIDELKRLTKAPTTQELLNNSIALFTWAIKQKQKGRFIASVDDSVDNLSYTEVMVPLLENVEEIK